MAQDTPTTVGTVSRDEDLDFQNLDLYVKDAHGDFRRERASNLLSASQSSMGQVLQSKNPIQKEIDRRTKILASLPWEPDTVLSNEPLVSRAPQTERVPKPSDRHFSGPVVLDQVDVRKKELPTNLHSPISDRSHAAFIYDIEDEEDIKRIERSMPQIKKENVGGAHEQLAARIAEDNHLTLDVFLQKRLASLLGAYLKELRSREETKELLQRSLKVGGLGLEESKAENILHQVDQQTGHKDSHLPEAMPRRIMQNQYRDQQKELLRSAVSENFEKIASTTQHPNPPLAPAAPLPKPQPPLERPKESAPPRVVVTDPSRPTAHDIRRPERIMGPVEELLNLGVSEYRKLAETAEEAIEKVEEKVDLLGEESFAKRLEGMAAWRQSPLVRLYLEMGAESLQRGETISEVARRRQGENKSYLTEEEFMAIADLNSRFRM